VQTQANTTPNPDVFDGDDGDVVTAGPSRPAHHPHPSTSRLEGEEGGARATPRAIPARAGGGTHVTPQQPWLSHEAQASASTSRRVCEPTYQVDVRHNEPYRHPDRLPYGGEVEMETSHSPTPELRPRQERRGGLREDNSSRYRYEHEHDTGPYKPWSYNSITQLVSHNRCNICVPYMQHYMAAATSADHSLQDATQRQHKALMAQVNNDLLCAELEIEKLRREREYYQDRCLEAEARLEQYDKQGKRKRPRHSEDSSTSRDAERRVEQRTSVPPPSPQAPAHRSNPIFEQDVNMHDIPEELDSKEFPSLPPPAAPTQPVHTRPWIDNLGVTQANSLAPSARTPAHHRALQQWKPKQWTVKSTIQRAGPSTLPPVFNDTGASTTRNPTGSSTQAARSLQQEDLPYHPPTQQDDDQTWAKFFSRVWPNLSSRRAGLRVEDDGSVSLRPIRGSRLISKFTPRKGEGDQAQHRSAYT
jgi:hypothetical protein